MCNVSKLAEDSAKMIAESMEKSCVTSCLLEDQFSQRKASDSSTGDESSERLFPYNRSSNKRSPASSRATSPARSHSSLSSLESDELITPRVTSSSNLPEVNPTEEEQAATGRSPSQSPVDRVTSPIRSPPTLEHSRTCKEDMISVQTRDPNMFSRGHFSLSVHSTHSAASDDLYRVPRSPYHPPSSQTDYQKGNSLFNRSFHSRGEKDYKTAPRSMTQILPPLSFGSRRSSARESPPPPRTPKAGHFYVPYEENRRSEVHHSYDQHALYASSKSPTWLSGARYDTSECPEGCTCPTAKAKMERTKSLEYHDKYPYDTRPSRSPEGFSARHFEYSYAGRYHSQYHVPQERPSGCRLPCCTTRSQHHEVGTKRRYSDDQSPPSPVRVPVKRPALYPSYASDHSPSNREDDVVFRHHKERLSQGRPSAFSIIQPNLYEPHTSKDAPLPSPLSASLPCSAAQFPKHMSPRVAPGTPDAYPHAFSGVLTTSEIVFRYSDARDAAHESTLAASGLSPSRLPLPLRLHESPPRSIQVSTVDSSTGHGSPKHSLMGLTKVANEHLGQALAKERRRTKSKGVNNNCLHLWEFLRNMLNQNVEPHLRCIEWTNRERGEFRLIKTAVIANAWGQSKNRSRMTYEKMARAMRYYYKMHILEKVPNKRLHFRFGEKMLAKVLGPVAVATNEVKSTDDEESLNSPNQPLEERSSVTANASVIASTSEDRTRVFEHSASSSSVLQHSTNLSPAIGAASSDTALDGSTGSCSDPDCSDDEDDADEDMKIDVEDNPEQEMSAPVESLQQTLKPPANGLQSMPPLIAFTPNVPVIKDELVVETRPTVVVST